MLAEEASNALQSAVMELSEYLKQERGRTARVAAKAGLSPAYLSQIANGVRPCPHNRAPALEKACDYLVRRWDLCKEDWHETWPDLIDTEGAPDPRARQAVA